MHRIFGLLFLDELGCDASTKLKKNGVGFVVSQDVVDNSRYEDGVGYWVRRLGVAVRS